MTCPYWTGHTCALLRELAGIIRLAAPGQPHSPCATCQSQWLDGRPPTQDSLTPILAAYARKSEDVGQPRGPCLALGPAVTQECCPGARAYRCDVHGEIRLGQCAACPDWLAR